MDKDLPTCPVCGYRVTLQYARWMWEAVKASGAMRGMRLLGVVARCEECSTSRRAVVIPYTFRLDELEAA